MRRLFVAHLLALFLPPFLLQLSAATPAKADSGSTREAIEALKSSADGVDVVVSRRTGAAAWVRTGDAPIELASKASQPAEMRAREFLSLHKSVLGLPLESELRLERTSDVDEVGMEHVRFQQAHRGIPVTGADVVVHLRGSSMVAASSKAVPNLDSVPTDPQLSADEAVWIVQEDVDRRFGVWGAAVTEPRLEILDRGLLEGRGRFPVQLAWFVEARAEDFYRWYWIDAVNGVVALDFNVLTNAKDREVWDAGTTTGNGTLAREEGDPDTGDGDVDSAYEWTGRTWDYFSTYHGRDSYNDNGATIKSTVHWCYNEACTAKNAVWNGVRLKFTEGLAESDVVAHEFTHGVVQYTAGLYYYMQSGALNESYADIFGETLDLLHDDVGESDDDWWIGEDTNIGKIRYMLDPTQKGDPGKMSDSQLNCGSPGGDNGGVHTNSGIPNHAYALMVSGGSYNGYTIFPMGLTKAAKIQYRALSEYLVDGSDFLDNAQALEQACSDLVGTSGITAIDCLLSVQPAIEAVEMEDPWACTSIQEDADAGDLCPAGYDVEVHYSTDFTSTTDWSFDGSPGWRRVSNFTLTGDKAMRANSQAVSSTDWLKMETDVTIPGDATYLQFDHSFGFYNESTTYFDGGQVLYSPNAGGNWLNLGSKYTSGVDYNDTIPASVNNPLGSVEAFVGDSYGYVSSRYTLTSFFGQDLRMGWRLGSAASDDDDRGWFIDNVTIYSCSSCVGWDITGDEDDDGYCNDSDNCPDDVNADQANADGDSLGDECDDCPYDADNDADSDNVCGDVDNCPDTSNATQTDSDSDDIGDACDACPNDADNDIDVDGVCGNVDNCPAVSNADQADTDFDLFGDACDACVNDPLNDQDTDGVCGDVDNCPAISNADQADTDSDDYGDACDLCANDPNNDADFDLVCGDIDNCPADTNADQADTDSDDIGDVCDTCPNDFDNDADSDLVCGDVDNCPAISNADQADADEDDIGDVCDTCPNDPFNDADSDLVCGNVDNCPDLSNADQADADSDDLGDLCDACPNDPFNDIDSDGVCGDVDNCPNTTNADQSNVDLDLFGDACDACVNDPFNDIDSDGVCGDVDNCPDTSNADQANADSDATGDACDVCPNDPLDDIDADGSCGDVDNCPDLSNPDQADADGDGVGNACDLCLGDNATGDGDGDGLCADLDCDDADPTNACSLLFGDGFDSGDTSAWSAIVN